MVWGSKGLHCMNSCLKFTSLMRRNCQCSKKTTLPKTILLNLPVVVKLFQVLPFRKFDSPNKNNLVATPPKFNMEPENDGFQKESPFPEGHFQVPC